MLPPRSQQYRRRQRSTLSNLAGDDDRPGARSFEFDSMFVTFSTKHDALSMTMDDLVILDASGAFSPTVLALQSSWTLRKLVLTVTSYIFVDTYTNAE
jgi:hypothetical protein